MPNQNLDQHFFSEQTEASKIKSKIVSKYLDTWGLVLSNWAPYVVYADFFAGCGKYDDESPSTPLEAISKIAARDRLREKVKCVFNEFNAEFYQQLCDNINEHPEIDSLNFRPLTSNQSFAELPAIEQLRNWLQLGASSRLPPTLAFVDPWGYKGLSLKHFGDILKHRGCEVIFFFNYNRINGALTNPFMRKHMSFLFGQERAEALRSELALIKKKPQIRESIIISAVKEMLQSYVLPQKVYVQDFKFMKGNRTSHHVIFATTHTLGFGLMKEVMATESASYLGGVPSYLYSSNANGQLNMFGGLVPLGEEILKFYSGQSISVKDVYDKHQMNGPYIKKNYKEVLLWLEETGQVGINPPRSSRRSVGGKPTIGDAVMVSFP